jgi:hypothetical protein
MNHQHLTEEELIQRYYGEESDPEAAGRRLEECGECRALYAALQRTLNVMDALPVPERGPDYGERVWRRISKRLSPRPRLWLGWTPWRWAAAGAAFAGLLAAAFLAGRSYPRAQNGAPMAAADPRLGERVLLAAVGDYLERSQMVLVELVNADPKGPLDISAEQARAADLVSETRLYRQTAAQTGDGALGGVLDDLERVLVGIAHEPSSLSPEALEKLRERLKTQGILFRIRVLDANVRRAEEPAASSARRRL